MITDAIVHRDVQVKNVRLEVIVGSSIVRMVADVLSKLMEHRAVVRQDSVVPHASTTSTNVLQIRVIHRRSASTRSVRFIAIVRV